ncbi:hypothetical protein BC936DRAFT_145719 [Jimgerdemannia flammicorona]|uniref:Lysophospholipase n=1 Tax=Jimgerdemannia flammicorona TaxID=994334 RepID=A0A433D9F2_9FUNG|nr:hypothetical protein BC936DRAFT_145719 [Jimgerdemannia flammicorona]
MSNDGDDDHHWHLRGYFDGLKNFIARLIPEGLTQDAEVVEQLSKLDETVKNDLVNAEKNPEIQWTARLRSDNSLSEDEQKFLKARKAHIREAFAKYVGVDVSEVHEDDIPVIAAAGSEKYPSVKQRNWDRLHHDLSSLLSNVFIAAYLAGADKSGLFDCLTYIAGVSGSCWGIAQYYTIANCSHSQLRAHYNTALNKSPGSHDSINDVLSTPDAVSLVLGGLTIKHMSKIGITAMDLYGAIITGHLLLPVPADEQGTNLNPEHFKLTNQRKWTDDGRQPLPIYTAVRHERPWKDWKDPDYPFTEGSDHTSAEHTEAQNSWFQWFEFNPYEIGCDELKAWQPSWSFGRHFDQRVSTDNIPEQSLSLEMGVWGSAPAGPLSSYLGTIQRNLPKGVITKEVNKMANNIAEHWGPQGVEVFEDHHPVHAANNPNPVFHFYPPPNPPGIHNSPRVHLIDAGMDNNLPLYPLAHPSREIDIILGFDSSSDVQKNSFFQRVEDFGKRKGYRWNSRGGQPPKPEVNTDGTQVSEPVIPTHPTAEYIWERFGHRYITVYDGVPINPPATKGGEPVIGKFNTPQATRPVTLLYIPLLPNKVDPEFDPCLAPFVGSYNLVYKPEEVEKLWNTTEANWRECEAKVKAAVTEVWLKKKEARLARK